SVAIRHPRSFPTRRSSDLAGHQGFRFVQEDDGTLELAGTLVKRLQGAGATAHVAGLQGGGTGVDHGDVQALGEIAGQLGFTGTRSEEHTSELQSRENLVCR